MKKGALLFLLVNLMPEGSLENRYRRERIVQARRGVALPELEDYAKAALAMNQIVMDYEIRCLRGEAAHEDCARVNILPVI